MIDTIRSHTDRREVEIGAVVAAAVVIAVCCAVPFALDPVPAGVVLVVGVAGAQLVAHMVYARLSMLHKKSDGAAWHEPRAIYALPVVGALFSAPAVLSSTADLEGLESGRTLLVMLMLGGATIPLAYIALIFVWAPVELLARGAVQLYRGNRSGFGYIAAASAIAVLTAFGTAGALAVDTPSAGRQTEAQGAYLAALFGVPGDYTVADPTMLIVARVLGAIMLLGVLTFVMAAVVAPFQRKTAPEASDTNRTDSDTDRS
ncbi:hypothetical protein GCM10027590_03220 [Nocardiopsis nanhaiensis]